MTALRIIRAAMNSAQGYSASTNSYSTNFDATENPLSEGGVWINGSIVQGGTNLTLTNLQSGGGLGYGTQSSGGVDDSIALCNAYTSTANQKVNGILRCPSLATMNAATASHEILIVLRATFTSTNFAMAVATLGYSNTGRYFQCSRNLQGWTGIGELDLASAGGWSGDPGFTDGMAYSFEVTNQTYKFILGGSTLINVTDDNSGGGFLTSGRPGIGAFWRLTENINDFAHDSATFQNI